jgi:flavin reductase ActVB
MSSTAEQVKLIHQFRSVMGELVSGVAAITVSDDGAARGMLATSISSYSDCPPSILVSLAHTSRTRGPLLKTDAFGVHLLAREQADLAAALAGRSNDKFTQASWNWDHNVPRLNSSLGYLRCRRSAVFEHHDHTIVVGDVDSVEVAASPPMVYFRRALDWSVAQDGAHGSEL